MGKGARRRILAGFLAILPVAAGVATHLAQAQPSAADKATAEALFDAAKHLMAEGKYAEACPKLVASYQIDPGIGTQLNLGVCYEKNGQTASAWATFKEAATAAAAAGQTDRAALARSRAAALEPLLARLMIAVEQAAMVDGLEVRRDGVSIGSASFGVPLPVDPGEHVVEARAPKRKPFVQRVSLTAKGAEAVQIPTLEREPEPVPTASATTSALPSVTPTASASAPPPPTASTATAVAIIPPPSASPTATTLPPPPVVPRPPPSTRGDLQRSMGSLGVVLGTLGVAAGGISAVMAKITYDDSNGIGKCTANACTQAGLDKRGLAFTMGDIGTGALISGGVLLAGGILLLVTAPSSGEPSPPPRAALRFAPDVGPRGAGVWVNGTF